MTILSAGTRAEDHLGPGSNAVPSGAGGAPATVRTALERYPRTKSVLQAIWRLRHQVRHRYVGEILLHRQYRRIHGRRANVKNPVTFSEKLLCRMVAVNRDGNRTFTELADKYRVRQYVAKTVGHEHLVRLLWCGADPGNIPFDRLPEQYVIKTNHASGQTILVRGPIDRTSIQRRLSGWLRENYYWAAREYHYFDIPPLVVIEELLETPDEGGILDYRFWCFDGVPSVIQVDNPAHDINPFYDVDWNQLDLWYRPRASRPAIARPAGLEKMIDVASTLSKGFDFVRVDLYNVRGKTYFGEMTFTPLGGGFRFQPAGWDERLGLQWTLSPR